MEKSVVNLVVFNDREFWLLEKPNSQLSFEPGSCYLRDRPGGVRDPGDAQQYDTR
jgi:hypothetical protein